MRQLHLLWSRPAHLFQVTILAAAIILTGAGCTGDENSQQAGQPGQGRPGAGGNPGGRPAQEATPVAMTPAVRGDIASYYRATASLEAEKEARILVRVTGVVGKLFVEEGDEVAAGDPLLLVENPEYKFRLQQAEATTGNLRSRYQRFEAMLAEDLTTEEEYQAARSDLANAEAEEGLARLNLSYTTVRAPFAGRVTSRLVDLGQNLAVGNEVMVMADFHPLLARVHVPSREFNKLKQDQTVGLSLDSSGEELRGRIKLISPVIDPASGTIKVTVEVPEYPAGTRPGDFAEVNIVTELRRDTLLVPSGAVFNDKGESVVYVVGEGGQEGPPGMVAHRRTVVVGFTDDRHTEILEGLTDGDAVVTRGQRSLKDGAAVKILDTPS
jgi:membrane fusion protein (multidrug efflux system)